MNHPLLYEINSRCWLRELSDRLGTTITLANVPDEEFEIWRKRGFSHIWLMGVWATGPRARRLAIEEPNLRKAFDDMIPGWTGEDVGGSPYSIGAYNVPDSMGGDDGLRQFRARLHKLGMKLILDFVPNHVGFDHPWVASRPELFVQSPVEIEGTFPQQTSRGTLWIAHAKDPYFPHWSDVAQLEYRSAETRKVMQELLMSVASRCDGVRCDMAMLLLNDVFPRTWAHLPYAGEMPKTEFWSDTIPAVKEKFPGFIFMAEVYWGLEGHLQWLGFDYTYDKQLYDDLIWHHTSEVQKRLLAAPEEYVASSVHFLENHDEARIATSIPSLREHRAAALTMLGLPGVRLLHEGQLTGAKVKVPVQLSRRPAEPVQNDVETVYEALLAALKKTAIGHGHCKILIPRAAWQDNPTGQNFVLVQWQVHPREFDLVVVNLAPHRSQCYAPLSVEHLAEQDWQVTDFLGSDSHQRSGKELAERGLYLNVSEHAAQLFHFVPVTPERPA